MTALTIDNDDGLIDALRATAARRQTTSRAIVGSARSAMVDRESGSTTFRDLASLQPLGFETGRRWDREDTRDRAVLR